jgi:hypothetical protein
MKKAVIIAGLSQNEIRQKENLSPIADGDQYLDSLNMQAQN